MYVWVRLSFGVLIFISFVEVMLDSWSMVFWGVVRVGGDSLEEMSRLCGTIDTRYGLTIARCCRVLLEVASTG